MSRIGRATVPVFLLVLCYLYLYQPFGIEVSWNSKTLIYRAIGVGVVAIIYFFVYTVFYLLQHRANFSYRRYHYSILVGAVIILAAVAIDGYESYLEGGNWVISASEIGESMFRMTMIFMLPMGFFFAQHLRTSSTRSGASVKFEPEFFANQDSGEAIPVILKSTNNKEILSLCLGDICYITSLENYVKVYHLKDGKLRSDVLRNTIQNLERQLKNTSVVRCHRGYLVNLSKVYSVNKANQRLYLQLLEVNEEIVVSRSYVAKFKEIYDRFTENTYRLILN
ncbi:MAG: LytTR family DNA-binding domain-containing protein [Cyclobacteriaceae bacterium]